MVARPDTLWVEQLYHVYAARRSLVLISDLSTLSSSYGLRDIGL
jgi:hypothetical protein